MLFAIGGAMDCTNDREILKRLLAQARGTASRVCVITSATSYPDDAYKSYMDAFTGMGVAACSVFHLKDRQEADASEVLAAAAQADIIFFSGGDQQRLAQALAGSDFMKVVADHHAAGRIVAGTSAGAAAMSADMIYEEKKTVSLLEGFGLTDDLIVDTHFSQRGRLSRLFGVVAHKPAQLGLGVDENTAAILKADGTMEVIGAGTVTVVDSTARAETLRAGEAYDLRKRMRMG